MIVQPSMKPGFEIEMPDDCSPADFKELLRLGLEEAICKSRETDDWPLCVDRANGDSAFLRWLNKHTVKD